MQTVKRGAGRPTATARREKAAQRTPLPPKAGVVDAAGEAIREATAGVKRQQAKAAQEERGAELLVLPVAQLRDLARGAGMTLSRTTKKAAMVEHILEAEQATALELAARAQRVASVQAARPAVRRRSAVDEVAPKKAAPAARKSAAKAPKRGQETRTAATAGKGDGPSVALGSSAVVGVPAPGDKSEAKATALITEAGKLGWFGAKETKEAITTAVLTRGDEIIHIQWNDGVFIGDTCTYSYGGRTIKVHNASAAKKRMAMPPEAAEAERQKVAVNRSFNHRATVTSPREHRRHKLPFTLADMDQEVLDALYGRRIYWVNSISEVVEDDLVPSLVQSTTAKDGSRVSTRQHHQPWISEGTNDGRIINFVGFTGFRAVRLSSIIRVR